MTITTLAGLLSGLQLPNNSVKVGGTSATGAIGRGITNFYLAGYPAVATPNSATIDGRAVNAATYGAAGRLQRNNPGGGNKAYVAEIMASFAQNGLILLADRIWENSGINVTLTTLQSITPATPAARDRNLAALGDNVVAGLEWSTAGGAGTPTVTLTYTDSAGNTGQTASLVSANSVANNSVEFFMPATGFGVRVPTGVQFSATHTSGTVQLVLWRILAVIPCPIAYQPVQLSAFQLGIPQIFDDACLQVIGIHNINSGANIQMRLTESWG